MAHQNGGMPEKESELDPRELIRGFINAYNLNVSVNGVSERKAMDILIDSMQAHFLPRTSARSVEEIETAVGEDEQLPSQSVKGIGVNVPVEPYVRNEFRRQIRSKLNLPTRDVERDGKP